MTDVNVSTYPGAAKPADPLSMVGGVVGLQNALTQGAAMRQELAAKNALGQAWNGNIDKTTGLPNIAGVGNAIAGNPATAYLSPQAFSTLYSQRGQNLTQTGTQQGIASNSLGQFATAMAPYLSQNGDISPDTVRGLITTGVANGSIDRDTGWSLITQVPRDPKSVKPWALPYVQRSQTAAAGLTPSVPGVTGQGSAHPGAGYMATPFNTQNGAVLGAGGNTAAINNQISKVIPPNGARPAPGAPVKPTGDVPPGTVQTGLSPTDQTMNDTSAKAYAGGLAAVPQVVASTRSLQSALPIMEQLSNIQGGPTSAAFQSVRNALISAGVVSQADAPNDPGTLQAMATKYLMQNITMSPHASRSDLAEMDSLKSSPNLASGLPAAIKLAKNQIGFNYMDAAAAPVWKKQGGDPNKFLGFQSGFSQDQDPRAYSFHLLNPTEQQEVLKSLGPQTSQNPVFMRFYKSQHNAADAGFLPPQ